MNSKFDSAMETVMMIAEEILGDSIYEYEDMIEENFGGDAWCLAEEATGAEIDEEEFEKILDSDKGTEIIEEAIKLSEEFIKNIVQ